MTDLYAGAAASSPVSSNSSRNGVNAGLLFASHSNINSSNAASRFGNASCDSRSHSAAVTLLRYTATFGNCSVNASRSASICSGDVCLANHASAADSTAGSTSCRYASISACCNSSINPMANSAPACIARLGSFSVPRATFNCWASLRLAATLANTTLPV